MRILFPLIAVLALAILAFVGASVHLTYLFGVIIPYVAAAVFVFGFMYRVVDWARSPVPFRIPTTGGQEKSLPWIQRNRFDSPYTTWETVVRMAAEIFLFRSLFRNTKAELREGPSLIYGPKKWLWAAGLAFHYSFFIIFIRHLRLFLVPIPAPIEGLDAVDSMFQILAPPIYLSDLGLILGVTFLFLRRVIVPQVRYISLPADYFPLFLILGIALTGMTMRYFDRVDIIHIKEFASGLASFHPTIPQGINPLFFTHLFLVSTLGLYFPFSKLMHMGGVFLSPTRNLANNSRAERHVNPWNYPVKVHSYDEWEDEFRDKLIEAGIPVEKKG